MTAGTADVCFLSSAHDIRDKRVFQKEAQSLAAAGFRVVSIAPSHEAARWAESGVELVTYEARDGRSGRIQGLRRLYSTGRKVGARAYHCNEVDSWVVGLLLRRPGRRIVFDAHEHYPPSVRRWLPRPLHPIGEAAIRFVLQLMALVTTRVVLAKSSIADDYSWSSRRHVIVGNHARTKGVEPPLQGRVSRPFEMVHTGVLSKGRGSLVMATAFRDLVARGVDARLTIIGSFNDDSESQFDRIVSDVEGDRVVKTGWLSYDEAFEQLRAAHAGLILLSGRIENNVRAMPHKLFDYMLAGLAVIGPETSPDVAEIIRRSACGVLVDPEEPQAVADQMERLASDRTATEEMGLSGSRTVRAELNWEKDAEKLVRMYEELIHPIG